MDMFLLIKIERQNYSSKGKICTIGRRSINFKFPLKSANRGFFQGNKTTIGAIREDIKILLMTVKGERVMHKNMGTNIPILAGQLI